MFPQEGAQQRGVGGGAPSGEQHLESVAAVEISFLSADDWCRWSSQEHLQVLAGLEDTPLVIMELK